jgi:hypothetical protein
MRKKPRTAEPPEELFGKRDLEIGYCFMRF